MTTMEDALIPALRSMGRTRAPRTLLPSVLDAVGVSTRYATLDTEIGTLHVAFTAQGIRAVTRDVSDAEFERSCVDQLGVRPRRVDALPDAMARGVVALLSGDSRAAVRFDLRGLNPFQVSVLETALRIPRGEVRPYSWIARRIGKPLAVRAVGTALAHNPIPYLIPCHRVVRADGHIGNYGGGGPTAKRAILQWEGVDAAEIERLARHGVRFVGSDTTRIFCYPTCRHARRITDVHRIGFANPTDARAAGYRPCKDCTPAAAAA